MDPVNNPYSPGAGNHPPALVGRETDLAHFNVVVKRLSIRNHDRSVIITGLRGVGKTVLLREFGRIAERHRWIHNHVEVSEDTRFIVVITAMLRRSLLQLSRGKQLAKHVKAAMRVLKAFQIRWELPEGIEIAAGIDPVAGSADSGLLDRDLADLFVAVGELAQKSDRGVLLTIDEMQFLPKDALADLIMALHEMSQLGLPFLIAGAGLPSLSSNVGDARSYAERLFEFRSIGRLDADGSAAALVQPAKKKGVRWDQAALKRVTMLTDGYPYFLQEFGKQIWFVANGPDVICLDDVDSAVPLAIEKLDEGFFRVRYDRTTGAERGYLNAMATLGTGDYASGDVAAAQRKTTAQVAVVRDALIRKGLCYSPRHGVVAFTVPMFADYLRRHQT
ncbi:MAG: ATP-binding protein [Acidimicrobiia bacterium]|nr:ATP-binding protein [Acidimicrobiia bacterium]MCY4458320.1 ATP-binding protein [Acidimicrobiaceae bacterium]